MDEAILGGYLGLLFFIFAPLSQDTINECMRWKGQQLKDALQASNGNGRDFDTGDRGIIVPPESPRIHSMKNYY